MKKLIPHTRRPDISFHRNGTIRLSSRIVRILSISPGDSINIALSDGEYLLHAIRHPPQSGRFEAQCRASKRGGRNLCANSVRLCSLLMQAIGCHADKIAFPVGQPTIINQTLYLPIITLNPIKQ